MTANVDGMVRAAINAFNNGNKAEARALLERAVENDEYNADAWLWLAAVVDTDDEKRTCLENVLVIDPDNARAKAGLAELDTSSSGFGATSSPAFDESDDIIATSSASSGYSGPQVSNDEYDDWMSGLNIGQSSTPAPSTPAGGDAFGDAFGSDAFSSGGGDAFGDAFGSDAFSSGGSDDAFGSDAFSSSGGSDDAFGSDAFSSSGGSDDAFGSDAFSSSGSSDDAFGSDAFSSGGNDAFDDGAFSSGGSDAFDFGSGGNAFTEDVAVDEPMDFEAALIEEGGFDDDDLFETGGDLYIPDDEDDYEDEGQVDVAELFAFIPGDIKPTRLPGLDEDAPTALMAGVGVMVVLNLGAIFFLISNLV